MSAPRVARTVRNRLLPLIAAVVAATSGCHAAASWAGSPSPWDDHPAQGAGHAKEIYLTFDDGPGTETGQILDILRENNAKAVFFAIGQNLDAHHDLARRVINEGHVVASHTWSHQNLTRVDAGQGDAEIDRAGEALRRVGSTSRCLRPPEGATNDAVKARLRAKGLRPVLWNVDTEDWKRPGADVIADRLVSRVRPGMVVLLHDGGGDRSQTVQALRTALPALAAQGYAFRAVPGC
ncbi:chitooligosaccharide deacetylase [Streptoalloteichus tenebrarius]|uniref:Chitooligosaccharide deacetylase n=1 Tax=Streptoalloteichus tenebrarius (strain ATCC 17920 / DSM 40477 / JCM 4838 / CBS 697.72 / NBRC 16177 / NCIMB 11028 / NRRL B-12390 / A12253. 1 / ISP 5477) TaxID=1933 RepID=A0ABT1HWA3_STRSD|nr:polysaccharide deacetylase family protein [Streptoalloteichus tenebrarius]MCP2259803.1 chitooligosaccharide deacetylase [Streptoalloteichus tenebrarius]BFE99251.1 hypothetical protein GCM10020241_09270 [Streptoalloteichus tenebrarius]